MMLMVDELGSRQAGKCLGHWCHWDVTYSELPRPRLLELTNPYCLIPVASFLLPLAQSITPMVPVGSCGCKALQQLGGSLGAT